MAKRTRRTLLSGSLSKVYKRPRRIGKTEKAFNEAEDKYWDSFGDRTEETEKRYNDLSDKMEKIWGRSEKARKTREAHEKELNARTGTTAGDRAFFNLVRMQNNGKLTSRATLGNNGG